MTFARTLLASRFARFLISGGIAAGVNVVSVMLPDEKGRRRPRPMRPETEKLGLKKYSAPPANCAVS